MASSFVVWEDKNIDGMVSLGGIQNMPKTSRLLFAKPLAADFPPDVTMAMRSDRPDNTILTDCLHNTDSILVASEKLTDFLRERELAHLEYLPLTVLDHRGKKLKTSYFIVHPVELVECVNAKASGGKPSLMTPGMLMSIRKLVLDEPRIPATRQIFRAKEFPGPLLVRRELATAIDAAGFVGPRWVELTKFPE